jgi:protein ImuA
MPVQSRPDLPQAPLPPVGGGLPAHLAAAVWRGDQLAPSLGLVVATGYTELDAELPGGGWPSRAVTEILLDQAAVLEWRLLAPALARIADRGDHVALVGPPRVPHLPGLEQAGLDGRRLLWVNAQTPEERLWSTEQLLQANDGTAVVAWLPQASPEQLRRLQAYAQDHEGVVFAVRPAAARHEPSAAPLRLHASPGPGLALRVVVLKRRGPAHDAVLTFTAAPGSLATVLPVDSTPVHRPPQEDAADVVGRNADHELRSAA